MSSNGDEFQIGLRLPLTAKFPPANSLRPREAAVSAPPAKRESSLTTNRCQFHRIRDRRDSPTGGIPDPAQLRNEPSKAETEFQVKDTAAAKTWFVYDRIAEWWEEFRRIRKTPICDSHSLACRK